MTITINNRPLRPVGGAANLVLIVVVAAVAAMSWHGLVGFAHDELGITSPLRFLVPISLDGAAVYAAFLALAAVIDGESAAGARMLVVGFAGASAYFNYHHAAQHGGVTRGQFFAAMSIATVVLFDQWLRQLRRGQLRKVGALPAVLPRHGWIRWVRFPRDTFRAWSAAVHATTPHTPTPAVEPVAAAPVREPLRAVPTQTTPAAPIAAADVAKLPNRSAQMRAALAATVDQKGYSVPRATRWLQERGLNPVDRSTARKLIPQEA